MLISTCLTAFAVAPLVLPEVPSANGHAMALIAPPAATLVVEARPTAPAAARVSKGEKKKYEPVQIKTQDKLTLTANFYAPKKKGRAPAALLIHGAGSNALALNKSAEYLQRKGFAVLALDLRGHGESVSEKYEWATAADLGVKTRTWAYAMRDLEAATDYLRDLDNVHNSNLSLVGMGEGAVLAAKYALNDENTRAVAFIEPTPEIYGYNMMRDVCDLGGLPALIMATDKGRQQATRIKNAAAKANDGYEYVKLQTIKPKKADDLFSDTRLNSELAKFLQGEAFDKR